MKIKQEEDVDSVKVTLYTCVSSVKCIFTRTALNNFTLNNNNYNIVNPNVAHTQHFIVKKLKAKIFFSLYKLLFNYIVNNKML